MEGSHLVLDTALPEPAWAAEARLLLGRARDGDVTALPALRSLLDGRPELWRDVGDLAQHAELTLVRLAVGDDLFAQEAVRRQLAALKAELAGPSPGPLTRLLVDRVGVCWLQAHHADLDAARVRLAEGG
jgi:hypothetical protein